MGKKGQQSKKLNWTNTKRKTKTLP